MKRAWFVLWVPVGTLFGVAVGCNPECREPQDCESDEVCLVVPQGTCGTPCDPSVLNVCGKGMRCEACAARSCPQCEDCIAACVPNVSGGGNNNNGGW